jgi:hypothetical protein
VGAPCEYSDEPSGSGAMELISSIQTMQSIRILMVDNASMN